MHGIDKRDRIALLVDGPNSYAAAKQAGVSCDYEAVRGFFSQKGRLCAARYYTVVSDLPEFEWLHGMLDGLSASGWQIRTKPTYSREPKQPSNLKMDMDVEIALDMFELADRVDVVVLFSGDSDFVDAVHRAQRKGCRVVVVGHHNGQRGRSTTSAALRGAADFFIEVTDLVRHMVDASGIEVEE